MFEGDSADMCARKFPLVSMGGRAEGLACADPGARTPIGASGNFCNVILGQVTLSPTGSHLLHWSRLCFTDPNITFKDILQPNDDNSNVVGNMNQSDCTTNTSVLSITVPNILEDIQTSTSGQEDTIILTEPLTPTSMNCLDIPIVILPESTVITQNLSR